MESFIGQVDPTRRVLLGAVAAAPLAAIASPAHVPSPDALVIALCAEIGRLERQRFALFYGPTSVEDDDERDELQEPLDEARQPLMDRLCATACRTPAGIIAKLVALVFCGEDWADYPADDGSDDHRLLGSVLRDALRISHADVSMIPGMVEAVWPAPAAEDVS